jgi:hypothetical protein
VESIATIFIIDLLLPQQQKATTGLRHPKSLANNTSARQPSGRPPVVTLNSMFSPPELSGTRFVSVVTGAFAVDAEFRLVIGKLVLGRFKAYPKLVEGNLDRHWHDAP